MRTVFERAVGRTDGALSWRSRFMGFTKVCGGILFFALLHNPVQAFNARLPDPYSVTLTWDPGTSPEVAGYHLYYGAASGNYTNSIVMGNATTVTVSRLSSGVTYFFAVTAIGADGQESGFSDEISLVPGLPTVQTRVTASGQAILTVKGLIGRIYDIQATQDFKTWTIIGTVTVGADGSLDFTDTNAAGFPKRFYRTRDTQL